jgi:hypothetical protein
MTKKFEVMFGGAETKANAKKMLTIFVMVASLALVAMLANIQTPSVEGQVPLQKYCESVKITSPADGSFVKGVVALQGIAKYGNYCLNKLSGTQLSWEVEGNDLGHGSPVAYDFGTFFECQGKSITLTADIPEIMGKPAHSISKTISVRGTIDCPN